MRSPISGGMLSNRGTNVQTCTTTVTVLGLAPEVVLDVPVGYVAIVIGSGIASPSSNTLELSVLVDGVVPQPQRTGWINTTQAGVTAVAQVPPGRHHVTLGISASTGAGNFDAGNTTMAWVIVPASVGAGVVH